MSELHAKLLQEGHPFEIIAFPCNQFGGQEPGTNQEIRALADSYNVKFIMSNKVDVEGPLQHPVFALACHQLPGLMGMQSIKWNFTKFLFDAQGNPFKRFAPTTSPFEMEADIRGLLSRRR